MRLKINTANKTYLLAVLLFCFSLIGCGGAVCAGAEEQENAPSQVEAGAAVAASVAEAPGMEASEPETSGTEEAGLPEQDTLLPLDTTADEVANKTVDEAGGGESSDSDTADIISAGPAAEQDNLPPLEAPDETVNGASLGSGSEDVTEEMPLAAAESNPEQGDDVAAQAALEDNTLVLEVQVSGLQGDLVYDYDKEFEFVITCPEGESWFCWVGAGEKIFFDCLAEGAYYLETAYMPPGYQSFSTPLTIYLADGSTEQAVFFFEEIALSWLHGELERSYYYNVAPEAAVPDATPVPVETTDDLPAVDSIEDVDGNISDNVGGLKEPEEGLVADG